MRNINKIYKIIRILTMIYHHPLSSFLHGSCFCSHFPSCLLYQFITHIIFIFFYLFIILYFFFLIFFILSIFPAIFSVIILTSFLSSGCVLSSSVTCHTFYNRHPLSFNSSLALSPYRYVYASVDHEILLFLARNVSCLFFIL